MNHANWIDRFIKAALWSAGTSYLFFGINFLGQIALARLLLPKDFGLYAYAFALRDLMLIFLGFATTQSFLYTDADQDQFNANVIINLIGCITLVIIGAGGLAIFSYQHHALTGWFFLILSIAQALTMMSYVYLAPLEKELNYRVVSLQQGFAGVMGLVVAIGLAYFLHTSWSLVLRDVLSGLFAFLLAYRVAPKKLKGEVNWDIVKKQFNFGFQTAISRALEIFCYRFPDIIVNYFFGKVALGNFYQARYLCYLPIKLFTPFTQQVLFAFFTNIRDQKQEMAKNLYWINYSVLVAVFPIVLAVYLWGDYFIVWLYGAKWQAAGIYFRYFALFIMFGTLFNMMQSACYSIALQKNVSIAYVLGIIVFVFGLIISSKPEYSALAFSFGFLVSYTYLLTVLKKHALDISLLKLYGMPTLIAFFVIGLSFVDHALIQLAVYIILVSAYFFFERKNLILLIRKILKR